ncbi:hypothetical protein ACFL96_19920 [Thermoproteota archaeon]
MMRLKYIPIIAIMLLLVTVSLVAADDDEDDDDDENNLNLGWYEVAEWEMAICQDVWAGNRQIESEGGDVVGYSAELYTNDIIISLSTEVSEPIPFNSTTWSYIYEVSWYIQPIWTAVNYELVVKDANQNEIDPPVESSSSSMNSGYSGYQSFIKPIDDLLYSAVLTVPEAGIVFEMPFLTPNISALGSFEDMSIEQIHDDFLGHSQLPYSSNLEDHNYDMNNEQTPEWYETDYGSDVPPPPAPPPEEEPEDETESDMNTDIGQEEAESLEGSGADDTDTITDTLGVDTGTDE